MTINPIPPETRIQARRPHLGRVTSLDREKYENSITQLLSRLNLPGSLFGSSKDTKNEICDMRVSFNPDFKQVGVVKVLNNKSEGTLVDIREVSYRNQDFTVHLPFQPDSSSRANIGWLATTLKEKALLIDKVESHTEMRLGTTLVQLAIEQSLKQGRGGHVILDSINNTSIFYYKLGFDCKDASIQKKVEQDYRQQKERLNGGDMFLTDSAIELWKQKISENPILASRQGEPTVL